MTRPVYEVTEHRDFFRLKVTADAREVFSDAFAYLDDRKAFEMAEEVARRLELPQDDGVSVVRIALKVWDEFTKAPNSRREEAVRYASYLLFQLGFSEETALYELGRWNEAYHTQLSGSELERCIPEAQNRHGLATARGKVTKAWEGLRR